MSTYYTVTAWVLCKDGSDKVPPHNNTEQFHTEEDARKRANFLTKGGGTFDIVEINKVERIDRVLSRRIEALTK